MGAFLSVIQERLGKKPFRFLDLPPELRNEVYSHLADDIERNVVRRISWDLSRRRIVRRDKSKALFALLLTNKQIKQEAFKILYSAIHGEVRWDHALTFLTRNRRTVAIKQMNHVLRRFTPKLNMITHLDLHGSNSDVLFQDMKGDLGHANMILENGHLPTVRKLLLAQQTLLRLRDALPNLETVTVLPENRIEAAVVRERLSKDDFTSMVVSMFPKLKAIKMNTSQGVETVWPKSEDADVKPIVGQKRKIGQVE